ncbi:XRE family transcriptional regulator, partial [Streptococcus cristatus]
MPEKKKGILQEHINEQLDNRRRPLKREKQEFSMIAVLGGILFLITLLVTIIMQLG